jgi:hypothetical protein
MVDTSTYKEIIQYILCTSGCAMIYSNRYTIVSQPNMGKSTLFQDRQYKLLLLRPPQYQSQSGFYLA